MNDTEQIEALVAAILEQLAELRELQGNDPPTQPNGPATAAKLDAFEKLRGIELPADYRAFLLHDGWPGFSGEARLLFVEEMTSGPLLEHIEELQTESREGEDDESPMSEQTSGSTMTARSPASLKEYRGSDLLCWVSPVLTIYVPEAPDRATALAALEARRMVSGSETPA